ncbi:recombination mediator RecR [Rhodoflexus caldus]|uniref:recombination mediator RecR n=1 Tax=Rhodoflexus caldus TaxID=2891236 RepID=UPI00202ABD75|nr:recombination mediator RecR [Rhodoflexus caldus]
MNYPSKLVEDAVAEISKLPGIGKKTALRLALHLLKQEEKYSTQLAEAIVKLRTQTTYCQSCHHISESAFCHICSDNRRDRSIICVVEESPDILAIENTGQYTGLYHVLGGIISPIEGIGPADLHIESLVSRIAAGEVKEIILAISATMEGDTTAFYLSKRLKNYEVKITTLARGLPVGSELEYTDEVTLGRSILARTTYET